MTLLEVFEKLTDLLRQGATDDAARVAFRILSSIPYSEIEMPLLSIRLNKGIAMEWSTDRGFVQIVVPRVEVPIGGVTYRVKKNEWERVQCRDHTGSEDNIFAGYCMDIAREAPK